MNEEMTVDLARKLRQQLKGAKQLGLGSQPESQEHH